MAQHLITLNAGSSSLKFAVFEAARDPVAVASGAVEAKDAERRLRTDIGGESHEETWEGKGDFHEDGVRRVLGWCERAAPSVRIAAAGHRVVHGGLAFEAPVRVDDRVMAALEDLVKLAPLHQGHNLAAIRAAQVAFPGVPQVACFDTAFHRGHPFVHDTFALPRRFYDEGVRRYGFHGLSYEYIAGRLREIAPAEASGRVVVAHLGNGASMCAMQDGRSVASTMGFSVLDGLPMGTRCGQLDPGVVLYLLQEKSLSAAEVADLLYHQSGLEGLSGVASDMRELEASAEPAAGEAIEYFAVRVRRELGGLAAALGGLDAVVFTGGIGEHSWRVRERVLDGMGWLGIELDPGANRSGTLVVSAPGSAVRVFVVPTNEELAIARHTAAFL